ncbi:MAG: helix-turn-helix transcriptional regulator [Oscillospiraceae bacterium]|nr:helix-turn-helix transcriptional regulator [Oscillospiraceae bacterium]
MANNKISLNKGLIRQIKADRISKGVTAAELSAYIGKTASYVSALEKGRIARILRDDLIKIVMAIHNCPHDKAIEIMGTMLSMSGNLSNESKETLMIDEEIKEANVKNYNTDNEMNEELLEKMIGIIGSGLRVYYKVNSERAILTYHRFIQSMQQDLGLIMAIINIPYHKLDSLTHKEKQKAFDDISDAFHKHYKIAEDRENNRQDADESNGN